MKDLNPNPLYSAESEKGILGAAMAQPEQVVDLMLDTLTADDFFQVSNREVFKIIAKLHKTGMAIDMLTVHAGVVERGLDESSMIGLLGEMMSLFRTHLNVDSYMRTVKEKSKMRALQNACVEIVRDIKDHPGDVNEVLSRAESRICVIGESESKGTALDAKACVRLFMEQQRRIEAGTMEVRLKTGLMALDQSNGGLPHPGYVVIAGEPGMGKSALILNIMQYCAENGAGVGGFTAEMTIEQCVQRMAAGIAGMDSRLMNAPMGQEWRDRRDKAAAHIERLPLFLEPRSNLTPRDLRVQSRIWAKKGCKMIWLDNAQLMVGSDNSEKRTDQLTEVSRTLQNIQKEHGITFILIAQVTKKALERGGGLQAFDLADCAAFQRDARVMIMIEKDPEATIFPPYAFPLLTRIVKYSEGEIGAFKSTFNKQQQVIT